MVNRHLVNGLKLTHFLLHNFSRKQKPCLLNTSVFGEFRCFFFERAVGPYCHLLDWSADQNQEQKILSSET